MKLLHGKPQFVGKPKRSPLDSSEPYLLLKNAIASGKFKPMEIRGLELTEADARQLEVKNVGRLVRDHLNRFLKRSGLASEYRVMWRTMANGNTYVGVSFEPPLTSLSAGQKRRREREKKEAAG